jgi:uncharacterized GH25 family protein
MKKVVSMLAGLTLTALLTGTAAAHDGWSQTNSPIVPVGEVSYVELMLGNHSNHHASYRIEGKWSTETSKVFVTTPSGQKADISGTLFYTGEEQEVKEPGKNNYYVASFSSSTMGAYIVSVEGDSIFKSGDVSSRTLRSAKSFVAVADVPTAQRVAFLKGFQRQVNTDRLEMVPLFNPTAVKPGTSVSVQLFYKGQIAPEGTEVALIRRSSSDAVRLKTDAEGKVTFETGPADYYLMRASITKEDEKEAGKYDKVNYAATMTFVVQNGKGELPATESKQPLVVVNGQGMPGLMLENREGRLYVPASFVKEKISPAFAGDGMVPLRASAESNGAQVEYFAPVGGMAPMVTIYTAK